MWRNAMLLLAVIGWWLMGSTGHAHAQLDRQNGPDRFSSIVIDARTGAELEATAADEPRYPASLTKLMTLYLTFEALREHRLALGTLVPVSPHAASMQPSKLGLLPGMQLSVEQAILGLVTESANDAAAALGELIGGSEPGFAEIMTRKARVLGMTRTAFRNASGLPDLDQVTTARDMARLAQRLIADFPDDYRYFSTPNFRYRGRLFPNHDHMLESYPGADGLKTGYITASGFNLVTSAMRGNVRLIGVVLGAARPFERDAMMRSLLDAGFSRFDPALVQRPPAAPQMQAATQMTVSQTVGAPPRAPARQPSVAGWRVQVGAFGTEASAMQAAQQARRMTEAGHVHVTAAGQPGHPTWRAELVGMNASEASNACSVLLRRKIGCLVMKPELRAG